MEFRSLELFLHLADTLHFGKTSEAMHVSPSTLSRVIQRLEQESGSVLFERDNRSVSLTVEGKRFRLFAKSTLAAWYQFKQQTLTPSDQLTGKLSVFCSVTASYSHLPPILHRLNAAHPKIDIKLETGDAPLAMEKVSKGEVDVAISAKPSLVPSNLAFSSFDQTPIELIGPNNDLPLSNKLTQELSRDKPDWLHLPYIVTETGLIRSRADSWFADMNINPEIYATVSGHEAIVAMVALGLGVGLVPDIVIEHSPVRDKIRRLDPVVNIAPFELGVCCLNQRLTDPLVHAFWQQAQKKA